MFDLLIKGGTLIDPAQGIHGIQDIAISNGKIAQLLDNIDPHEANRVIDVKGKLVTPGLIDLHLHVAHIVTGLSVPPDDVGVKTAVTTVVDGGSTGYANFEAFKRFVVPQARTDIFAFIHVTPNGLSVTPETWGWYDINPDAILKTIEANRDIIKGIKMRAIGSVIENQGVEAIKTAKRIASEAKLPLSVHVGIWLDETTPEKQVDAFTIELLNSLERGDIIEHIYTANPGGIIKPDGTVFAELWDAIKRGVVLDVANGIFNFSFNIARIGLEKGVLPTTLSTDFVTPNFDTPMVLSLTVTMSKFLALGLNLEQVIEMTTFNPAKALGEEKQRGSLSVGMKADISVLELLEGNFLFQDRIEKRSAIKGKRLLVPRLAVKEGEVIEAGPRYIEYVYERL